MPDLVDPTPSGPTRELGVLPRGQQLVPLPLELPQVLDHDGLRRHVDAEGEGLGGEHDADQPLGEQRLHGLLEHREHPRVMGRDAGGEPLEERPESERLQIVLVDPGGTLLGELADPLPLVLRGQADPAVEHPLHAAVAPRP